jgi:hypothetical protein
VAGLRQSIPETVQDEDSLAKAEAVAVKLRELNEHPLAGFDEAEKKQKLAVLTTTLSERVFPYIARLKDAALAKYRGGQDGDGERAEILGFATKRPALTGVIETAYQDAKNGVEVARQVRLVSGGLAKVMDGAANARDAAGVQSAAAELARLESAPETKLLPGQVKATEDAIAGKYLFFAQGYAKQAGRAYAAGEMAAGQKAQKDLSDLVAVVLDRFGKGSLSSLEKEVEAGRMESIARRGRDLTARTHEIQEAGKVLTHFNARIQKGDLRECVDGVGLLSGFSGAVLLDAEFRARREAVVADYAALVSRTLLQMDPLEGRSARLKAADEILNASAAEAVFAGRMAPLRESLAAQKVTFILRLVNRSGQPLLISGQDLRGKLALAADARQDLELRARSGSEPASFTIEGGANSKSRIETIALAGAGGRELILTALDKVSVVAGNLVPPGTGTPSGVTATTNVTPAASVGKGRLAISVVPRTAKLTVNGSPVIPGNIEVAPNETHRVQVEASGYKPFLQYYRVGPDETRKIEVFLEKAAKKTFLGL